MTPRWGFLGKAAAIQASSNVLGDRLAFTLFATMARTVSFGANSFPGEQGEAHATLGARPGTIGGIPKFDKASLATTPRPTPQLRSMR